MIALCCHCRKPVDVCGPGGVAGSRPTPASVVMHSRCAAKASRAHPVAEAADRLLARLKRRPAVEAGEPTYRVVAVTPRGESRTVAVALGLTAARSWLACSAPRRRDCQGCRLRIEREE